MTESAPARRNVVVFVCDQLRRDYLSLYGCAGVPTPNLDRLAASGVVFDRAIAQSPVCGPGRATMMTGRYVSDHGVWANDIDLRDGVELLPRRMNAAGYLTGGFGKFHHYPADAPLGFAVEHRFEESRMGVRDPYVQWLRQRHPEVTGAWNTDGLRFAYEPEAYYEHWIASRAIDFIEANAAGSAAAPGSTPQPLFAWVSFQGPHHPHDPPSSVVGTCDLDKLPPVTRFAADTFAHPVLEARGARIRPRFTDREQLDAVRLACGEMIVFIDQQIGRVIDALEDAGIFDNTTILFTTDHGEMMGDHGLEQKGPYPYGQHLEVPLMVANHPGLAAGTRSADLVGTIDLAGTALDIAGDTRRIGMSRSLLGDAGPCRSPRRAVNFSEFNDSIKIVENERFRFCYYPFTRDFFLYDPVADPQMTRNLADDPAHAGTVSEMLAHVVDFQLLAKGVGIEAHDLVWRQQRGLAAKDPGYAERLPVVFPLTADEHRRTVAAGVDATFNEPFRGGSVFNTYEPPYWEAGAGGGGVPGGHSGATQGSRHTGPA